MTYQDFEFSQHDGSPVYGYEFTSSGVFYRLTSAERTVSINSNDFTPHPISHGPIRGGTQNDDNLDMEITMRTSHTMIQTHAFGIAPPQLSVTIYRFHQGSNPATEFIKAWVGKVTSYSVSGDTTRVRVPSIFTLILNAEIPNVFWQAPCNHVLYDVRCKVNPASFSANTTVASITNDKTIVVANDGFPDTALRAGELIDNTTGERRTVVDNVANVITVVYPFARINVGDSVTVRRGCDHAFNGDCLTVFNNQINFGGVPFLPAINPFDGTL